MERGVELWWICAVWIEDCVLADAVTDVIPDPVTDVIAVPNGYELAVSVAYSNSSRDFESDSDILDVTIWHCDDFSDIFANANAEHDSVVDSEPNAVSDTLPNAVCFTNAVQNTFSNAHCFSDTVFYSDPEQNRLTDSDPLADTIALADADIYPVAVACVADPDGIPRRCPHARQLAGLAGRVFFNLRRSPFESLVRCGWWCDNVLARD
jgi:hypothetical protein